MEKKLPEGWIWVSLIELLARLESGSRPKGGVAGVLVGIPSIGGEHLNYSGGFNVSRIKYIPTEFANQMNNGRIQKNDILIVKDGATTGKTCFVDIFFPFENAYVNEHVFIARTIPEIIDPKFVFWYLWSKTGQNKICSQITGTAQGGINQSFAYNIEIPLPPLLDQHRIAEKLDQLMGYIREAQAALDEVPVLLKQFRQKVLAMAVSGELTREWREENSSNTISFESKSKDKNGWAILNANECCKVVQSGITPKGKPFTDTGDVPFLKVYNIVDQKIDFDYKPQFIPLEVHQKEAKRSIGYPNDVLMNIVGPPLGKVALLTEQFPEWNMNQAITLFRCKPFLLPKFLYFVLCEGTPIKIIAKDYRGVAGQSNISLSQCRDFEFAIPPLDEQSKIINTVEHFFFIADQITSDYKTAKDQLESLPQAILAKAFSGKLTSITIGSENALALLQRIREEKVKLENIGKRKASKTIDKKTPKSIMSTNLTIKELLEKTPGVKVPVKEVLEKTKYNKSKDNPLDMNGFYEELKAITPSPVREVRESGEVYLILENHAY